MPNLDQRGPLGAGPRSGRGRGIGIRKGLGGSKECTCTNCGYKVLHKRGIPCSTLNCPECKTPLKGIYCQ